MEHEFLWTKRTHFNKRNSLFLNLRDFDIWGTTSMLVELLIVLHARQAVYSFQWKHFDVMNLRQAISSEIESYCTIIRWNKRVQKFLLDFVFMK